MLAEPRMPAESEPHERTWLAWPHNASDWPGKLAPIHWVYVEIVRQLARFEDVSIIVQSQRAEARATRMLRDGGADLARISLLRFETDRSWLRDSGPSFVRRGSKLEAVCWRFNAWAKYSNYSRDELVAERIAKTAKARAVKPTWNGRRVVLEGGAIDVDGQGTLLATEECLLSKVQQRNPGFTREDYEAIFEKYLGVRETIWLGAGIKGDDTHGHVDDVARFVSPGVVVAVGAGNIARLKPRVEVIELPSPRPLYFRGERLPASYANFYVANGLVLVPMFSDPNDRTALNILSNAFPGREVIGFPSVDLVWGFGSVHCATQQQPKI